MGVHVLDAPVSGGPVGAEAGALTIMVGGPAEVLDGVRELLGCVGKVVHAGGPGAGQALKLCNNLLAGCAMAALAEACALAVEEGLDPKVLFDAVSVSTGDSRVLRNRFPLPGVDPKHPASNEYRPLFALDLLVKDLASRTRWRTSGPWRRRWPRRRWPPSGKRSVRDSEGSTTRRSS